MPNKDKQKTENEILEIKSKYFSINNNPLYLKLKSNSNISTKKLI
ncbi:hypothetical protein SMM_1087 [Spiroplasma mirum ATCC 29335]|nr:hypothetical protein SMM_1087 [Spiroplasma mirum ATCC 29335]